MAVAAAELGVELQTFIDQQERPPEEEVYGRSLSSARRLGAVAVHLSAAEAAISPEAEQVKKEFDTSVEEGLGTDVEIGRTLKVRDFDARPVINGHVMSKDGKKSIASLTAAGLDCAEKQYSRESSQGDTRFDFQLTRSKHDDDNVHI